MTSRTMIVLVATAAAVNSLIVMIAPCNDGMFIGSCFIGRVFVLILSALLFLLFLLVIGIEKLTLKKGIGVFYRRTAFATGLFFLAVYAIMIFASIRDFLGAR